MVKIILVTKNNYDMREVNSKSLLGYSCDKFKVVNYATMFEIYVIYMGGVYKNDLCSSITKIMIHGEIAFVKMDSKKMIDISLDHIAEISDGNNDMLIYSIAGITFDETN